MEFCNLNINLKNKKELFELDKKKTKCIVTLNAQIICLANTNQELFDFVNSNYATIDGQVPLKVARIKNKEFKKVEKLSGSEIIYDFCDYAKKNNLKLFFLGGKEDSNKMAVENVKKDYDIQVSGYSPEYENYPFSDNFVKKCLDEMNKFKPDIVFVGFGAPKQEFFMRDHLKELTKMGVKYAVGSGGTVDFVAGTIKRAPKWISKIGMEGVYRLFKEFNKARWKRLVNSFGFFKYVNGKPKFTKGK